MFKRTLFDSDHEMFRDVVDRFIADNVAPYHAQWEKDGQVSRALWTKAGEVGLLCTTIPEQYGGVGVDFLYATVVQEQFSYHNYSGPGFAVHSDIVAPYILNYGSEALKSEWLPRMARGEAIGAIGMSEPSAGSDVKEIRTTAIRDGDDYVINGQKVFITNGQMCDFIVLAAKTDPAAGAKGVSLILVEADREGFTKGRNLEKVGYKAQDTSELFFHDVRVPVGNLIGEEGRGFAQLMDELPQERLLQAIRSTVSVESALEWTLDYTTERKAFGRAVADFQNTRFKLAEIRSRSVMLRVFLDRCIEMHVAGELTAIDAAMAKMLASEIQSEVLDTCLQLHGGYGYMWEYPIARAWTDARMMRIAGGTGEIMRELIGRDLIKSHVSK
ncbi:acyl-CoA dehydrogenase family protein [Chachezhania antarctica]|uniref:acyl-CoA dehydrogenase family protein n=1 Tax=Chachezhania antarctica TaxID=2340860 RepID=UPI000EACD8E7|nr:acyl-CoA dehydrogenase family protein [Chachezhania antarctica]|tara:strand:- start:5910 stop:7067 length:1158 start_codon:yes stop_codon:yes gene_type:complete